jgi:hypothetical protein
MYPNGVIHLHEKHWSDRRLIHQQLRLIADPPGTYALAVSRHGIANVPRLRS